MNNEVWKWIMKYGNEEFEVWKWRNESPEMKKSKYGNGRPFSATVHSYTDSECVIQLCHAVLIGTDSRRRVHDISSLLIFFVALSVPEVSCTISHLLLTENRYCMKPHCCPFWSTSKAFTFVLADCQKTIRVTAARADVNLHSCFIFCQHTASLHNRKSVW